jgi:carbonic anhydrase
VSDLNPLLEQNRIWAAEIKAREPDFFTDLGKQQTPEYLWIGCADSRVAANTIAGMQPGEIFVHRNIANLVIHTDMNCLSVLQFAVDVLKVKHVIVTGHYGCGGIQAAMEDRRHGLIDNWLRHIQDTANLYQDILNAIADQTARFDKLCELNVIEQVINTCETTIVEDAWGRDQDLSVHGLIYDIHDGILHDLDITVDEHTERNELRRRFLKQSSSASPK